MRNAGTGGGHFHQPQIDGIGQNGGQEPCFIFDRLSGFQVREMTGGARPFINLQKQFRDFDVRQQGRLGPGRQARPAGSL